MAAPASPAAAFSFSESEKPAPPDAAPGKKSIVLRPECSARLKNKRVVAVIGERHLERGYEVDPSRYTGIINELNTRLNAIGLRTLTPKELTEQVAQAEQEAILANDIEAAMTASKRLNAQFTLKGLIASRVQKNPVVGIDEVFVTLQLSLMDAGGRKIAGSRIEGATFSGADTVAALYNLVEEQADQAVAEIYEGYCGSSGK